MATKKPTASTKKTTSKSTPKARKTTRKATPAKKTTRTAPAAEKTARTQAKKSTPTLKAKTKSVRKPRVVKSKSTRKSATPKPDFTTKETLEQSMHAAGTQVTEAAVSADTTTTSSVLQESRAGHSFKWLWTLLGLLLVLLGIAGILAGLGYYLHTQALDSVEDHFAENDFRRGESINRTLEEEDIEVETVATSLTPNRPVYTQVYRNPFNDAQQLVEVNYLKRDGLDYDVTKSYRVVANTDDQDQVVEWAREYDLHTETPEGEAETLLVLQDLDLPEDQRQTEEEVMALLEERQAEFEALRTAIRAGETEFEGAPIPPDFTIEVVEGYLAQIETELDKLK